LIGKSVLVVRAFIGPRDGPKNNQTACDIELHAVCHLRSLAMGLNQHLNNNERLYQENQPKRCAKCGGTSPYKFHPSKLMDPNSEEWCQPCIVSHRTIHTTRGQITAPRAFIPQHKQPEPLTKKIAKAIENRWANRGNFTDLADSIIDVLCEHIAKCSVEKMDARISDAIEDHMSIEEKEGDTDAEREVSVEDLSKMVENVRNWNGGGL
jgi:hypothetical protein